MRFPAIHSLASRLYRKVRRDIGSIRLWFRHRQCLRKAVENDRHVEVVIEEIHHFNIIYCFHKYYAIPCGEGPFDISRAEKRLYSKTYSAYSLEGVIAKVDRGRVNRLRFIAGLPIISSILGTIGERRVRAPRTPLRRRNHDN